MRKLAFINEPEIKKIMVYEAGYEEVYVFYYDTWVDTPSNKDYLYSTYIEVEELCWIENNIKPSDWIDISDPIEGCQQDFIAPVRVKGRNTGAPEFGKFEQLKYNGEWYDISVPGKDYKINGTTVNERLFLSALGGELDNAIRLNDISKARKILISLQLDEGTVNRIIEHRLDFDIFKKRFSQNKK